MHIECNDRYKTMVSILKPIKANSQSPSSYILPSFDMKMLFISTTLTVIDFHSLNSNQICWDFSYTSLMLAVSKSFTTKKVNYMGRAFDEFRIRFYVWTIIVCIWIKGSIERIKWYDSIHTEFNWAAEWMKIHF